MILRYLTVLGEAPEVYLILLAALTTSLMVGLIFHEFCHAYVADTLGDRTPRLLGRLTLNPKSHYDPVGTTLIFFVGFGWAKPVPVNPNNTRNPKSGMAMIAFAGPLSNVVIAGLAGLPMQLGMIPFWHPFVSDPVFMSQIWTQSPADMMGFFLGTVVLLNILLALFNMLPIPPLDGSRVLTGLLPHHLAAQYARLEPWGLGILLLLIMSGFATGGQFSILTIIGPLANVLLDLFVGEAAGSVRF